MKKIIAVWCLLIFAVAVQAQNHQETNQLSKTAGLSDEQMKNILALHGHMCAGVAIGIRVSQAALREMGENNFDNELVAIVETDKCPVDAVQMLVGTTAGRQNLIYEKKGKNVFTFVRRKDGQGIKITVRDFGRNAVFDTLREKKFAGKATKEELAQFETLMNERIKKVLLMPESELLIIEPFSVDAAKIQRQ